MDDSSNVNLTVGGIVSAGVSMRVTMGVRVCSIAGVGAVPDFGVSSDAAANKSKIACTTTSVEGNGSVDGSFSAGTSVIVSTALSAGADVVADVSAS